jgi:hypothetical protein
MVLVVIPIQVLDLKEVQGIKVLRYFEDYISQQNGCVFQGHHSIVGFRVLLSPPARIYR